MLTATPPDTCPDSQGWMFDVGIDPATADQQLAARPVPIWVSTGSEGRHASLV
jgi:hypothetical protein